MSLLELAGESVPSSGGGQGPRPQGGRGGHDEPLDPLLTRDLVGFELHLLDEPLPLGLLACLGKHQRTSPLTGLTLALACGALQIGAYYFGLQPALA